MFLKVYYILYLNYFHVKYDFVIKLCSTLKFNLDFFFKFSYVTQGHKTTRRIVLRCPRLKIHFHMHNILYTINYVGNITVMLVEKMSKINNKYDSKYFALHNSYVILYYS